METVVVKTDEQKATEDRARPAIGLPEHRGTGRLVRQQTHGSYGLGGLGGRLVSPSGIAVWLSSGKRAG